MANEELQLRKDVETFSAETSFHGIKIVCGKIFILRRIIWILILLLMVSLSLFTLVDTVLQYNRYHSVLTFYQIIFELIGM